MCISYPRRPLQHRPNTDLCLHYKNLNLNDNPAINHVEVFPLALDGIQIDFGDPGKIANQQADAGELVR